MSTGGSKQTQSWADDDDESDVEPHPAYQEDQLSKKRADSVTDEQCNSAPTGYLRNASHAPAHAPAHPGVPERGPFRAFVGNIPHSASQNDLGNYFAGLGCQVDDVHISIDRESGQSKGFCHMEFRDQKSLIIALEQQGVSFMGRALRMDIAEAKPGGGGGRYGGGGRQNRYDDRSRGGDRHHDQGGRSQGRGDGGLERDPRFSSFNTRGSHRHEEPMGGRGPPPAAASDRPSAQGSETGNASALRTRPKLNLQPRSKPVGEAANGTAAAGESSRSSIFGAGRPQDERVFEERKKQAAVPAPVAKPSAAPSTGAETTGAQPAVRLTIPAKGAKAHDTKSSNSAAADIAAAPDSSVASSDGSTAKASDSATAATPSTAGSDAAKPAQQQSAAVAQNQQHTQPDAGRGRSGHHEAGRGRGGRGRDDHRGGRGRGRDDSRGGRGRGAHDEARGRGRGREGGRKGDETRHKPANAGNTDQAAVALPAAPKAPRRDSKKKQPVPFDDESDGKLQTDSLKEALPVVAPPAPPSKTAPAKVDVKNKFNLLNDEDSD